jgi:DnaD/phage-associated family protein
MARKAFVSSDMAHDERLFDVALEDPQAALLWPWIVTYLDDWGRGLASPKRIKSQLFPNIGSVTVDLIATALKLYASAGLIELYGDGEHEYMAIPAEKWFKWQTHIRRDKREKDNSKYPPCPSDCAQSAGSDNEVRADDCDQRAGDSKQREDARDCAQVREGDSELLADRDPTTLPPYHPTPTEIDNDDKIQSAYKEQAVTVESSSSSLYDPEIAQLGRVYQEEGFGPITPLVQERLVMYCDEYGFDWVMGAIRESVRNNVRKLSYVEKVLSNWRIEGRMTSGEGGVTIAIHRTKRASPSGPNGRTRSITGGKVGRV